MQPPRTAPTTVKLTSVRLIARVVLLMGLLGLLPRLAFADTSTALFDGQSFDGWQGNLEIFRVEDGAIVGGTLGKPIERNEFLSTWETYEDFELQLEVKLIGEGANAGVQFRTERIPNHHEVIGYQADMGQEYWGKLYDESRRNKILAGPGPEVDMSQVLRPNDWNTYKIRCEGPRIRQWLNGTLTVDYTETDASIPRKGIIAVQIHSGPPSEAWYRNIRLTKLPAR
jgi:hypothetical protein